MLQLSHEIALGEFNAGLTERLKLLGKNRLLRDRDPKKKRSRNLTARVISSAPDYCARFENGRIGNRSQGGTSCLRALFMLKTRFECCNVFLKHDKSARFHMEIFGCH